MIKIFCLERNLDTLSRFFGNPVCGVLIFDLVVMDPNCVDDSDDNEMRTTTMVEANYDYS